MKCLGEKQGINEINEILKENDNVILQFSASWCGPCKMIKPFMEELSQKETRVTIVYIDIDIVDSELNSKYNISSVPTFLFFKKSEMKDRISGANQVSIQASLKKLLES